MIKKINKIKKLGLVFSDYAWGSGISSGSSLQDFKTFNLIYGWNGSGKTTLSRLFDALGGTAIDNLEYEIEDENGNKYKQKDSFPKKVRVFNRDYIENNIKIIESRANSISILLGEDNKELAEQIEKDRELLSGDSTDPSKIGKLNVLAGYEKERKQIKTERDGKFTEVAKIIGAAIGGNALRDYRKPQAEGDFSSLATKIELSDKDLKNILASVKQESLPTIDRLTISTIEIDGVDYDIPAVLGSINDETKSLLRKTIESEVINRLVEHNDISEWVEQGIKLHSKHSSDVCEYCLQQIPGKRIKQLAHHFNEEDKKLKKDIDGILEKLNRIHSIIQFVDMPDKARFYKELQEGIETEKVSFKSTKKQALADITELVEKLQSKKSRTTEHLECDKKLDSADFDKTINNVNDIINTHNKRTTDFNAVKQEMSNKLKNHYLSTIFDEVKQLESDIERLTGNIEACNAEIEGIKRKIEDNTAKISSEHKACEVISDKLATFLGHKELKFIPHTKASTDEQKDVVAEYDIVRDEAPAKYLCEGEKTAIAFVYFVVHLGDRNFDVTDGIIVVDDPISSLDTNSLYQAFSFLKNAVKNGGQIFILTHSFEFLKLLINWRRRDKGKTGYFMLKNHFPSKVRCAYLDKMDKELCEYESEYHYLFKLLKQLRDEQDDSIAKAYPVPNIARKVWDTFLMFSVPNGENSYRKMEVLKEKGYDEQKLDAIYKFTNDQSHITGSGFNPALVPETKKVVGELFEMMEQIAPDHFKIIDQATTY